MYNTSIIPITLYEFSELVMGMTRICKILYRNPHIRGTFFIYIYSPCIFLPVFESRSIGKRPGWHARCPS